MDRYTRRLIAAPEDGPYSRVEFSYYNDPRFSKDVLTAVAFVQAHANQKAAALVHKWVEKLHKPDEWGPGYPDVCAAIATTIDRGDFMNAWEEARIRNKTEDIAVVVGRGLPHQENDDPPEFFAIYEPSNTVPFQPKS